MPNRKLLLDLLSKLIKKNLKVEVGALQRSRQRLNSGIHRDRQPVITYYLFKIHTFSRYYLMRYMPRVAVAVAVAVAVSIASMCAISQIATFLFPCALTALSFAATNCSLFFFFTTSASLHLHFAALVVKVSVCLSVCLFVCLLDNTDFCRLK